MSVYQRLDQTTCNIEDLNAGISVRVNDSETLGLGNY